MKVYNISKSYTAEMLPLKNGIIDQSVFMDELIDANAKFEVYNEKIKDSKLDSSWFMPTLQCKEALFEKAFGIYKEQIPSFLNNVISKGEVVSNQLKSINGRVGFERIYYYNGKHYVLTGIGTNGFIVTAYPIEYGG